MKDIYEFFYKEDFVMMTMREVCNYVGISRRVIQGYEAKKLVTSCGKNKYGYLLYDEETVKKMKKIRKYQDFGFSLKEIEALLTATDDIYCEIMQNRVKIMKQQLKNITNNINSAEKMIKERRK